MPTAKLKCRHCDRRERRETMIIGKNGGSFCNMECLLAYSREHGDRLRKKAVEDDEKVARKAHRAKKLAYMANQLPWQLEQTRVVFNSMIRLLDRGKKCPTCGDPLVEGDYDAGHVRSVGSCPQLRFDARNCFGQCRSCNGTGIRKPKRWVRQSAEVVSEKYKAWIIGVQGQKYHDWLYGPHPLQNWIPLDLSEMRKVFSTEVSRLRRGEGPSMDWRALPVSG